MSDSIKNSVLYFDTARELCLDLEGRFGQSNKARLFQVQKDVSCLSQGDMAIASYYTKAKQLWDESNVVSTHLDALVKSVNVISTLNSRLLLRKGG